MQPEVPEAKPYQWGTVAEKVILAMPEPDRLPFLAHVEQKARQSGDLEMLRETRAFRAKHNLL